MTPLTTQSERVSDLYVGIRISLLIPRHRFECQALHELFLNDTDSVLEIHNWLLAPAGRIIKIGALNFMLPVEARCSIPFKTFQLMAKFSCRGRAVRPVLMPSSEG